MPIYEYACKECKHIQEEIHKYSETPEVLCEKCNKPIERQIARTGFRLLGEWTSTTKPPIDWD